MIQSKVRPRSHSLIGLSIGMCVALIASDATAQCSRGGQGGPPTTGSQSVLTMPSSFASASDRGIQYPTPQSLFMSQSSMLSAAMQMSARQQYAREAYQQKRMPNRIARAEATRAKRAERIALAKAKRESEQRYASTELDVSETPKVTLVSMTYAK
ncbi:MAG: hypothetical protein WBD20_13965 [Pirellulaceae bacterium]